MQADFEADDRLGNFYNEELFVVARDVYVRHATMPLSRRDAALRP